MVKGSISNSRIVTFFARNKNKFKDIWEGIYDIAIWLLLLAIVAAVIIGIILLLDKIF